MAAKTLYWKDAVPAGATAHRSLQDGGSAPASATTGTGWVVDQKAIGQSCLQQGGVEVSRTDASWGTTLQPSAAPAAATGDSWRSELPLDGTFANANWTFTFGIRSVTAAWTGRLKLAVRVWRSSDPDGANAVELTSARQASAATSANLSTSADTTVTITWSPGGTTTLRGEYLFVNVGIEVTAAGSGNTQDVDFRVGSAYSITTSDFTPTPASTGDDVDTPWFAAAATVPIFALGSIFVTPNLATQAPLVAPVVNAAQLAPDASRARALGPDTSAGTPKTLTGDSVAARNVLYVTRREIPPLFAPQETSQRQPTTLQDIVAAPAPVVNLPGLAAPEPLRRPHGEPTRSRAIYDSTDVTRAPLVVGRRDAPRHYFTPDTSQGTALVLRAAVVAALPAGYPNLPAPLLPMRLYVATDTTTDTPKTLTLDAQAPVGAGQIYTTPDRVRPISDTTRGTPKPLFLDAQLPVGFAQQLYQVNFPRSVVDTTRGTPKVLFFDAQAPVGRTTLERAPEPLRVLPSTAIGTAYGLIAAQPSPFVNAPVFAPDAYVRRAVADTTRGTAKTLFFDAQLPVGDAQTFTSADRVRPVVDTGRGTPKPLIADAQAPVGTVQTAPPADRVRPVHDTTRGTPKGLFADAQAPVGVGQTYTAPDRVRPVTDTSRGVPKVLFFDAQLPVGETTPWTAADFRRALGETSRGTFRLLLVDVQLPPGAALQPFSPEPRRVVVDTTRGTPKTLFADAQSPVGETATAGTTPERRWLFVESSSGTPYALLVADVRPVGAQALQSVPARAAQVLDTTRGTPKPLFADAQRPVGAAQTFTPADRVRPIVDTTGSTPKTLTEDAQRPVGTALTAATVLEPRALAETSAGAPYVLIVENFPVGRASLERVPEPLRVVPDSTIGSAYGLLQRSPFFNPPVSAPDDLMRRAVVGTGGGMPKGLQTEALPLNTPPFFAPSTVPPPVVDTSRGARVELPVVVFATDPCYIATAIGRDFLATATGRSFLASAAGREYLATAAGRAWLATAAGREFLATAAGREFLAQSECGGNA